MRGYAAAVELASRCTTAIPSFRTASFHSSAPALYHKSTHFSFQVRKKRSGAESALKNLLFNERSSDPFSRTNRQKQQKAAAKSNRHSGGSGKGQTHRSRRRQKWRSFDEDDCTESSSSGFKTNRSFAWYWPEGMDHLGSHPFGFEWQGNPQKTNASKRIWAESDLDEESEDEPSHVDSQDLQSQRTVLGLSPTGPLKLEDLKSAYRASALKWHPDKHQGAAQVVAAEKFKLSVDAYNALAGAMTTD